MEAVLEAIEAHAQAAGATLDDPMTDVCIGLPWPRGRCGRVFWASEIIPAPRMPMRYSMNSEVVGDQVVVRFFWPIRTADEAAHKGRALEMFGVADSLRGLLDADRTLGGEVETVEVGASVSDTVLFGEAPYMQVDVPIAFGHREKEIS